MIIDYRDTLGVRSYITGLDPFFTEAFFVPVGGDTISFTLYIAQTKRHTLSLDQQKDSELFIEQSKSFILER